MNREEETKEDKQKEEDKRAEVWDAILEEEIQRKMLPSRKGFLKLHVFGSKAVNPTQELYCLVKNKTFKIYNDGRDMSSLKGVIDFDAVKCTI